MEEEEKIENEEDTTLTDEGEDLSQYPDFHRTALYAVLACGVIIALIGVYLAITDDVAIGSALMSEHSQGAILQGPGIIAIGLAFCLFPVYKLLMHHHKIKQKKNKPVS